MGRAMGGEDQAVPSLRHGACGRISVTETGSTIGRRDSLTLLFFLRKAYLSSSEQFFFSLLFWFVFPFYLQTGSGKTYTMGTPCKEGSYIEIIPRAMAALFDKIESCDHPPWAMAALFDKIESQKTQVEFLQGNNG
jgi:hypothetical protein